MMNSQDSSNKHSIFWKVGMIFAWIFLVLAIIEIESFDLTFGLILLLIDLILVVFLKVER